MLLPDPDQFLYSYIRKEAVLSSQIEGTQSSLSDLLLFENEAAPGVPLDDVREVSNYVAALSQGLKRLQEGLPVSLRLLREMHSVLLANGRMGRLLVTLLVCSEGILREPLLYLSLYLKKHRQQYYDHLQQVRLTGDWEIWLQFFLTGVQETADQAVQTAQRLMKLAGHDE